MKLMVNLRGVQATSRRQLRYSFQGRLSDRCHALCQENAQLKAKLATEKNNSVSLKRMTVQLCRESAEARDRVAQDKFLQEKLDKIDNEISQSQEDFKAELHLEREKKRLLQEKLQKKCVSYQERNIRYASDNIDAINQVHKLQRELENCVQQNRGLEKDYEELRVAHIYSRRGIAAELDAEREKNMLLQEELQRKCVSYEEISQRYASDSINAKHQVDNLLRELENGVQQHQGLQKDYEELRVAHTFSQQNFTAELYAERQKNTLLQEELQRTCVSYNEISQRYASDAHNARHGLDNLLRELQCVVQQHKGLQKDYEELRGAHSLSQKNFTAELHAERQKNMALQEELQRTRVSCHETKKRSQGDDADAVPDTPQLQRELEREVKAHADTVSEAWRVINNLRAELDVLLQKTAQGGRSCVREPEVQKAKLEAHCSTLDTDVDMECV